MVDSHALIKESEKSASVYWQANQAIRSLVALLQSSMLLRLIRQMYKIKWCNFISFKEHS